MTKAQKIAVTVVQAEANRFKFMLSKATVSNQHTEQWKKLATSLDQIANDMKDWFQ